MGAVWERVRARLREERHGLGLRAAGLYPGVPRAGATELLTAPGWLPDAPVPLESVRVEWDPAPPPPAVADPKDGLPPGHRTYAEAMAALAPPAVFEDRPSYRLLHAALPAPSGPNTGAVLRLGPARYFDGVNVGEAVAHELAAGTDGLPLRTRIGDPCDLSRRAALLAITTLTVTESGRYVRHWRDPAKVAHAGGLFQVMPVGMFQPLSGGPGDLDPWRCMVREYSEELLGTGEDYGDGFDQESWPFHRALTAARRDGRVRVHCLGLGVDPLTLAVDLLTVAVFRDEAFDTFFGERLVAENAEGLVSLAAFDGTVPEPVQPAGAAALDLAWRHRRALGVRAG
ncbi:transcriptional regulator [Actinomadura sp. J1-007]|nr:transcriptional regulator [Actinomadura sp. J1-007]